jgi:hypothetical protein
MTKLLIMRSTGVPFSILLKLLFLISKPTLVRTYIRTYIHTYILTYSSRMGHSKARIQTFLPSQLVIKCIYSSTTCSLLLSLMIIWKRTCFTVTQGINNYVHDHHTVYIWHSSILHRTTKSTAHWKQFILHTPQQTEMHYSFKNTPIRSVYKRNKINLTTIYTFWMYWKLTILTRTFF